MMLTDREFASAVAVYGVAAVEQCATGLCSHTHYVPAPDGEAMVDLRCPESMGKLLGRTAAAALPGGVVELACGNCKRRYRVAGTACSRVLHRFNLLGELLATEITA